MKIYTSSSELDINSELIANSIEKSGYSVLWLDKTHFISKIGKVWTGYPFFSLSIERVMKDWQYVRNIYSKRQYPVPKGRYFDREQKDDIMNYLKDCSQNVLIRPAYSGRGKQIYGNNQRQVEKNLISYTNGIIVENHNYRWHELRLLVLNGKCIGAYQFTMPRITGNGKDTIEVLVERINNKRYKYEKKSRRILKRDVIGLDFKYIPSKGEIVYIRLKNTSYYKRNVKSVFKLLNPRFLLLAEKIVNINIGLQLAEVHFKAKNIREEPNNDNYNLTGINCRVTLSPYCFPDQGSNNNVDRKIADYIIKDAEYKKTYISINEKAHYKFICFLHVLKLLFDKFIDKYSVIKSDINTYTVQNCSMSFPRNLHSELLVSEFKNAGLEVEFKDKDIFSVNYQNNFIYFKVTHTPFTSNICRRIMNDKKLAKDIFKSLKISVAKGRYFSINEKEKALNYVRNHNEYLVVKPNDSLKSKGVTVRIKSEEEFEFAWKQACQSTRRLIVIEEQYNGMEARFLVVDNKCIAVLLEEAPNVIGDGKNNIEKLIDIKNKLRLMNPHLKTRPILLDQQRLSIIESQGYDLESIPPSGEKVIIDLKSSPAIGGDTVEAYNNVHPSYKRIAEKLTKRIAGADVVGIDIIAQNFTKKATKDNYIFVEANDQPALAGHHYTLYGRPNNVSEHIVKYIIRKAKSMR